MMRKLTLATVSFFLLLFLAPPALSLHRDYVSYYSGITTFLEGGVEDEFGGLSLPLSLEVHSSPRFYSTSSNSKGSFSFQLEGLEPGRHEFWLKFSVPGYKPSPSLVERLVRENLEIYREGSELVVHGFLMAGKVKNLGVLSLLFDPLDLFPPESHIFSPATSFERLEIPFRASRQVMDGYREENFLSGWSWKEWAQVGTNVENRKLGPEAGSWIPTGRTYTIYGIGPLHTDLPDLPAGYRWTKISGDWNSATYREERNEVEILKAQGWTVTPQYRTVTEYQADVYHWEKVGTRTEYGSWYLTSTNVLGTNLTSPPLPTSERWEYLSSTVAIRWWMISYQTTTGTTYYRYQYTRYRWNWYLVCWEVVERGTILLTQYRGTSFTEGGDFLKGEDRVEYQYLGTYTETTVRTYYSYGYDTYSRDVITVDVYDWVFKGKQVFSSQPVPGGGWDYRNVTFSTRQELTGYLAVKKEPVYGWVERTDNLPPRSGTSYWENGKTGTVRANQSGVRVEYDLIPRSVAPEVGWITDLREMYAVTRVPVFRAENYTAYKVYEVPVSWSPVSATVTAVPKNGYSGPVYLEASGGSLGTRELRFSSPASTTLTVSPSSPGNHTATVRAYAVDLNGKRREVASGTFRVTAEGSARLVGVEGLLPSDNGLPGSGLVEERVQAGASFWKHMSMEIEAAGWYDDPYIAKGIAGFPVVEWAMGAGTSGIGIIVEVSGLPYGVSNYYFRTGQSTVGPREVLEGKMWLSPAGTRPCAVLDPPHVNEDLWRSDRPERMKGELSRIWTAVSRELGLERLEQEIVSGAKSPEEAWGHITGKMKDVRKAAMGTDRRWEDALVIATMFTGGRTLKYEKVGGTSKSWIHEYYDTLLDLLVRAWWRHHTGMELP